MEGGKGRYSGSIGGGRRIFGVGPETVVVREGIWIGEEIVGRERVGWDEWESQDEEVEVEEVLWWVEACLGL